MCTLPLFYILPLCVHGVFSRPFFLFYLPPECIDFFSFLYWISFLLFFYNCVVSSLRLYTSLWSSLHIGIVLKSPCILIIRPHIFLMTPISTPPVSKPKLCSLTPFSYVVDRFHGMTHFLYFGEIRNWNHHINLKFFSPYTFCQIVLS